MIDFTIEQINTTEYINGSEIRKLDVEYYEYRIKHHINAKKYIQNNLNFEDEIENIKFINQKISECEAEIRKLKIKIFLDIKN